MSRRRAAGDERSGDRQAVVRGPFDRVATWNMVSSAGRETISIEPILSLSSMTMIRDAARAGVGAARLPIRVARPRRLGALCDILAALDLEFVIRPGRRQSRPRSRTSFDGPPAAADPLNVFLNGRLVGRLNRQSRGPIDFQYDRSWLV
jgi:DNA-binding transcriptional LysR family regulator